MFYKNIQFPTLGVCYYKHCQNISHKKVVFMEEITFNKVHNIYSLSFMYKLHKKKTNILTKGNIRKANQNHEI